MAGFATTVYRTLFRRTSSMAVVVIGAAFFYERGVDTFTDYFFDRVNKGKQWKDIKHLYGDE